MNEIGLRMMGKDPQGLAKGVGVTGNGHLITAKKTRLLSDKTLTVTQSGFHTFGATNGRGHQIILDVSDAKNIIVSIDKVSGNPGNVSLLFFSVSGRITSGSNPINDPDILFKTDLISLNTVSNLLFSGDEYSILNRPKIGMVVLLESAPVGAEVRCRIIGGN
jgi:hypothetical protein